MTLRDQLKQTRLRYNIFSAAAIAFLLPPFLVAAKMKATGAQPPEYWPLLVILVLIGVVLLLISVIGQWTLRCPKCHDIVGVSAPRDRFCRRCGTDFDADVQGKV